MAILLVEDGEHCDRGKMVGCHFAAVKDDPDLPALPPDDLYFRDIDHLSDLVINLGRNSYASSPVFFVEAPGRPVFRRALPEGSGAPR